MGDEADYLESQSDGGASDDFWKNHEPNAIVCKYCGKGGLHWGHTREGYRTFEQDRSIHTCTKKNEPTSDVKQDMLQALYTALPYVEDAALDDGYKKHRVELAIKKIKDAIAKAEGKVKA